VQVRGFPHKKVIETMHAVKEKQLIFVTIKKRSYTQQRGNSMKTERAVEMIVKPCVLPPSIVTYQDLIRRLSENHLVKYDVVTEYNN
jgi:hypothetical protein